MTMMNIIVFIHKLFICENKLKKETKKKKELDGKPEIELSSCYLFIAQKSENYKAL
jgi:hypothetical protein